MPTSAALSDPVPSIVVPAVSVNELTSLTRVLVGSVVPVTVIGSAKSVGACNGPTAVGDGRRCSAGRAFPA